VKPNGYIKDSFVVIDSQDLMEVQSWTPCYHRAPAFMASTRQGQTIE
jgi:hypothetical protein